MNVAIVGSKSQLGVLLVSACETQKISVTQFTHRDLSISNSSFHAFKINSPQLPSNPNFSHLLYLAWAPQRNAAAQRNSYFAAKYVSEWADLQGVRVVFVSSLAALPQHPSSNYGRYKKKAEFIFLKAGHHVIRPGTIITNQTEKGSALSTLNRLGCIARLLCRNIKPINVPITLESLFTSNALSLLQSKEKSIIQNSLSGITTLQDSLGISSGPVPLVWVRCVHWFLPSRIGDRFKTLFDMRNIAQTIALN